MTEIYCQLVFGSFCAFVQSACFDLRYNKNMSASLDQLPSALLHRALLWRTQEFGDDRGSCRAGFQYGYNLRSEILMSQTHEDLQERVFEFVRRLDAEDSEASNIAAKQIRQDLLDHGLVVPTIPNEPPSSIISRLTRKLRV